MYENSDLKSSCRVKDARYENTKRCKAKIIGGKNKLNDEEMENGGVEEGKKSQEQ